MIWRYTKQFLTAIVWLAALAAGAGLVYVQATGSKLLSVQSGSMEPVLHKGDLVIVDIVSVANLAVGDIVTFINPANNKQTITHRVVSINRPAHMLQTRGDANKVVDQPINDKVVVGKVTQAVPYAGAAVDVVRKPLGLLLLVYIPAIVIIIAEMNNLTRYYKSQRIYSVRGRLTIGEQPARSALMSSVKLWVATGGSVLVLGGAAIVQAAISSTVHLSGNKISSVPTSYQVCAFPASSTLLSYALIDVLHPEQPDPPIILDEPVIPGTYKITAVSADEHTAHPNAPTQPNERWFVQLYGGSHSQPMHSTGVTDDIPDDLDETTTVIDESVTFTEPVTAIRYAHNAFLTGLEKEQFGNRKFDDLSELEKRQVIWNSVHPGCITFERVTPVRPPTSQE